MTLFTTCGRVARVCGVFFEPVCEDLAMRWRRRERVMMARFIAGRVDLSVRAEIE